MTRDSLVWTVGLVSSIVTFLTNSSGLLHAAFPQLTATGEGRIALFSAVIGLVSAYMKTSPLPHSSEQGDRP